MFDTIMTNNIIEGAWGTLEELLLACAVNRHGTKRWDSVAVELHNRTSNLHALSPQNCRLKYHDLISRRFGGNGESEMICGADMVDELIKLRVAELRREVQRRDVSIVSLQSKLKRLETEHQRSMAEEEEEKADLEKEDQKEQSPNVFPAKSLSGHDGSFNESNFTNRKSEDPVQPSPEPATNTFGLNPAESESEPIDDVDVDTSMAVTATARGTCDSDDLLDSAADSKAGRRSRKRRRRGADVPAVSSSVEEALPSNTTPLVRLIGIVRSHKLASAFERRLRSQETETYKKLVLQHMDMETVESRLHKGLYSHSLHAFFRDLLLLFNNAVVYFRPNSPEHLAALHLRALVAQQIPQLIPAPPRPALPSGPARSEEPTHRKPVLPPLEIDRRRKAADIPISKLRKRHVAVESGSSSEPAGKVKKGNNNKKRDVAEFLERMKQGSPKEKSKGGESKDDDEDDDENNNEGDDDVEEEDIIGGRFSVAAPSSNNNDDDNHVMKRGVGRPPRAAIAPGRILAKRRRRNGRSVGVAAEDGPRRRNRRARR